MTRARAAAIRAPIHSTPGNEPGHPNQMMYEKHDDVLLPRRAFFLRLGRHGLFALISLLVFLGAGMVGYHFFENLGWVDAYTNAAFILSGMGPLDPIKTSSGRIFAGTYALFCGVAFLTTVGFLLMPIVHRLLHRFHLKDRDRT
jgi:hypothetical protein